MKAASLFVLVAIATSLTAGVADAKHPLETTANAYREAVVDFERAVFRVDCFGRVERTLADALEDQTSRVRREARDLDHLPQLASEIETAARLHRQVEQVILGNPANPSLGVLLPLWQHVESVFATLNNQYQLLIQPPVVSGYRGYGVAPGLAHPTTPAGLPLSTWNVPRDPYVGRYGSTGFGSTGFGSVYPRIDVSGLSAAYPRSFAAPVYRSTRPTTGTYCPESLYQRAPIGRFGVGAYLQR